MLFEGENDSGGPEIVGDHHIINQVVLPDQFPQLLPLFCSIRNAIDGRLHVHYALLTVDPVGTKNRCRPPYSFNLPEFLYNLLDPFQCLLLQDVAGLEDHHHQVLVPEDLLDPVCIYHRSHGFRKIVFQVRIDLQLGKEE